MVKKQLKSFKVDLSTTAFILTDVPVNCPESIFESIRDQLLNEYEFSVKELDEGEELTCIRNLLEVIELYRVHEDFSPGATTNIITIDQGKRKYCYDRKPLVEYFLL